MTSQEARRIVIVDDSKYIRTFVNSVLATVGFQVTTVDPTSLFDVLTAIEQAHPDLLITDYEMPDCNGETLIRFMREDRHFKNIPILVLSAHREKDLVERLSEWNLCGYLIKPIRPDDLVKAVEAQMAAMEARRAEKD